MANPTKRSLLNFLKKVDIKVNPLMDGSCATKEFALRAISAKTEKDDCDIKLEYLAFRDRSPPSIYLEFVTGKKITISPEPKEDVQTILKFIKDTEDMHNQEELLKTFDEQEDNPFQQMAEQYKERQNQKALERKKLMQEGKL
eukprot:TRINITY_DN978_c3_g1_i1.p1 TRINITY_DN978_c3_g1~~TRINITY_DN978_c3_g1_i1.p1  ORF type:complete len:143 (-),score=50.57 TRINITY_DN978_c3_g1_i1:40-468(-)